LAKALIEVLEYIGFASALIGVSSPAERTRALAVALDMKNLDDAVNKRINLIFSIATPLGTENNTAHF
jgi:ribosomal protein L12E/L44/L45/RPP1/RPP2